MFLAIGRIRHANIPSESPHSPTSTIISAAEK
jgi:hypothetical protein